VEVKPVPVTLGDNHAGKPSDPNIAGIAVAAESPREFCVTQPRKVTHGPASAP